VVKLRNALYTRCWGGCGKISVMIDPVDHPIETPTQLRTVEVARNLQRLTARLTAPDRDPMRLHHQLLGAQRDLVAALVDLNAIVGGPALLTATTQRDAVALGAG